MGISICAPSVELVFAALIIERIHGQLVGARKALGFAAAYVVRCTRAGDFALTAAHFDDGGVTRLVDAQPVESWSQDRKGQVRRVDFIRLVVIKASHTNQQRARG